MTRKSFLYRALSSYPKARAVPNYPKTFFLRFSGDLSLQSSPLHCRIPSRASLKPTRFNIFSFLLFFIFLKLFKNFSASTFNISGSSSTSSTSSTASFQKSAFSFFDICKFEEAITESFNASCSLLVRSLIYVSQSCMLIVSSNPLPQLSNISMSSIPSRY